MLHIRNCKVLRPADFPDCTGGGITARNTHVEVLIDVPYKKTCVNSTIYYDRPDEAAIREYCHTKNIDESKVLILCDKFNNSIYTPYLKPLDAVWGERNGQKLVGPCAGGNYVSVEQNEPGGWKEDVYRVHDRYDTETAWAALSI